MTSLDLKTLQMVCGEEGFCRRVYKDGGNVATWGFGLTLASGFDIRKYFHNDASVDECCKQFVFVFNHYFLRVCSVLGSDASLEVLTGAASFHWNTGAIDRASWVHYWKLKEYETAEKHFLEWDKPASVIERREREARLIFHNEWNIQPCTEWQRVLHSGHIDWKSGLHVNIVPALKKALAR